MPYPVEVATNKHDLVGPSRAPDGGPASDEKLAPVLTSLDTLFEELERGGHAPGSKIAAVYTYADGPRVPGPLSRALFIIGFAQSSMRVVTDLRNGEGELSSQLHKCTVAVKLADNAHVSRLADRDVSNSMKFAELMRRMRKEDEVAIIGCDKHGRFGILCPMEHQEPTTDEYAAEDFAADCYVGNLKETKEYLANETNSNAASTEESSNLWQPPGTNGEDEAGFGVQDSATSGLWQPPGTDESAESSAFGSEGVGTSMWQPPSQEPTAGEKRMRSSSADEGVANEDFHTDSGAAAADRFYSGLTRDLGTRADSRLYHMRSFNGWVKATQIQELRPKTQQSGKQRPGPLRVLDLACGKGGDLGKWVLHIRGVENYVGVDVARGSLRDAAIRVRRMRNKLKRCTFTCADLGSDVPGRPRSARHKTLQKLLSWSLQSEPEFETRDPEFSMVAGGGISLDDKFDVVSIQFAIHYMMSTRTRARRFFQTVSQLLEIGGNLIATTIDARVVLEHLMNLNLDLHFHERNDEVGNDGAEEGATIKVGNGACRIHFEREIVRRIFQSCNDDDAGAPFGLQYTFTLVEGSDHAAGVGDAVNLPEWLTPIPVLTSLAAEAGLELEYAQNFHEFYSARCDSSSHPEAHSALYNMKVLDRHGSISKEEWEVSRLYAALKFRKVRESTITLDAESEEEETQQEEKGESDATEATRVSHDSAIAKKMFPVAMMKAKKDVGEALWQSLSSEEKNHLTQQKLDELLQS